MIAPWRPDLLCGPETGGARLAELIAHQLGLSWIGTQRVTAPAGPPNDLVRDARRLNGAQVAVVDDAINAGHATSRTIDAIRKAGGVPIGIG